MIRMQNFRYFQLLLALSWLLAFAPDLLAASYRIYVGDMVTLKVGKIDRVAVGNGNLMSTSILDNGELLVLAEKEGDTELMIWRRDGTLVAHKFYITKLDSDRTSLEAASVLKSIPGIRTRRVGESIVIEGFTSKTTASLIDKVAEKYKEMINLTVEANLGDIAELLTQVPGLDVKKVGTWAVVTGAVDAKGKAALEAIKQGFPEILDLTTEDRVVREPMIYMKVQITEFSTTALENLGINWSTSFRGPAFGYTDDFIHSGGIDDLNAFSNQTGDSPTLTGTYSGHNAAGFFGIATLIDSAINLAVSSGDALIIASPTLSAKSGGKAKFLSGGEIPIPVPAEGGVTQIEYREFGIKLEIEPRAGIDGNISAKIMTEVSSIDRSVAVNNVPGFKNRSADTEVSLRDGETLVISGLVNRDIGEDVSRMKWLSDIPILGALFRSTNFRTNRSDLVIFITPEIFDPHSETNKAQIRRAAELRQEFIDAINLDGEILD